MWDIFKIKKQISDLRSDLSNIKSQLDYLSNAYNLRVNERHSDLRPLDLNNVLWNCKLEPFDRPERRWEWIDKATTAFRTRCNTITINPTTVICKVLGRYWIRCNPDGGVVQTRLITEGLWELFLTEALYHEVKPGMTVIDAGAHIGYYSVIMADRIGSSGHIYVCEPFPLLASNLRKTFQLNWVDDGRLTMVYQPLHSSSEVDLKLISPEDTIKAYVTTESTGKEGNRVYSLKSIKLDDVVPAEKPVDFIHLDASGSEFEIWQGMQSVIHRSPRVTIFLRFSTEQSYDAPKFLDAIEQDGFTFEIIDPFFGKRATTKQAILIESHNNNMMLRLTRRD